ncbi:glycoside hydrolase family 16 protein [Roseateles sp.]|uniref:glycoside hydrolase family 16 protein n=1 Tax=Roseateles sp. TaxID=1971397 RepID=UPI0025E953C2|nr:glycoside hydrolase family 16 protein [Roseateles sp.]MBV8036034.1 glycoside hydrolase family 16 protein [Roseateles sp.]
MKALLLALLAAPALAAPSAGEFFDDFSQTDLDALRAGGWVLREGTGHPGLPGARFAAGQISVGAGLLRLRLSTDGTPANTLQPQLCNARKFLFGTTTARVRLRDTAGSRDPIVQAFYQASPLKHDFDPEFSEVDFEYLPHGGWGAPETRLYGVAWQTVRIEPWLSFNSAGQAMGSHDGWQLLTAQVEAGRVRHYVNGRLFNEAAARNVPVQAMAISFSHWLSDGATAGAPREYEFEVDWVLHEAGKTLSPAAMQARVAALRKQGVARRDTVPDSGLTSECNL